MACYAMPLPPTACPAPAWLWLAAAPMLFYLAWQLLYFVVVQVGRQAEAAGVWAGGVGGRRRGPGSRLGRGRRAGSGDCQCRPEAWGVPWMCAWGVGVMHVMARGVRDGT